MAHRCAASQESPIFGHQPQWSWYQQVNDASEQPWHLKSKIIITFASFECHLLQSEHWSPSAHLPYLSRAPPQTSPGPLRQTSPPQGPGPEPNWQLEFGWFAGRGVWLLWARGCRHQWGRLRARGQDRSSKKYKGIPMPAACLA